MCTQGMCDHISAHPRCVSPLRSSSISASSMKSSWIPPSPLLWFPPDSRGISPQLLRPSLPESSTHHGAYLMAGQGQSRGECRSLHHGPTPAAQVRSNPGRISLGFHRGHEKPQEGPELVATQHLRRRPCFRISTCPVS